MLKMLRISARILVTDKGNKCKWICQ